MTQQQLSYRPGRRLTQADTISLCNTMHLRSAALNGRVSIRHHNHPVSNCFFDVGTQTFRFAQEDDPSTDKILKTLGKRVPLRRVA